MATSKIEKAMSYTSGTDGIWTYRKYDDGTYHAWYEGNINLLTGSVWASGFYYHLTSSGYNPPSFSQSVTSMTGTPIGAVLALYCGVKNDTFQTYWTTGTSSSGTVSVRLDMYGTW